MLLSTGASLNLKTKEGKSPFSLAFEHGLTDLLKIMGDSIDLNQDPSLFFAFSAVSVVKESVHNLIADCMSAKTVEDETINVVNNDGFAPMLHYIH